VQYHRHPYAHFLSRQHRENVFIPTSHLHRNPKPRPSRTPLPSIYTLTSHSNISKCLYPELLHVPSALPDCCLLTQKHQTYDQLLELFSRNPETSHSQPLSRCLQTSRRARSTLKPIHQSRSNMTPRRPKSNRSTISTRW